LGTPATAILVQGAMAVGLILLPALGGGVGKRLGTGFEEAVTYTAPAFWSFFLLTGIAVIVLRAREPETARPFRVPLYPVPVIVFCGMCAWMLYRSLDYRALGAVVGVAVLLAGAPVHVVLRFGWKAFGRLFVRVVVPVLGAGIFCGLWLAARLLLRDVQGPVLHGAWSVLAPAVAAIGFAAGTMIAGPLTKAGRARVLHAFLWPLVGCAIGAATVSASGPVRSAVGTLLCGTAAVAIRELAGMSYNAHTIRPTSQA
jgi:hypothetical protein